MYNTQNRWVSGLYLSYGILSNYITQNFGNKVCARPQARGLKTPTLLRSLERANFTHWTQRVQVSKHCFLIFRIPNDRQRPKTSDSE
jgi:hypothetical protein